MEHRNPVSRFYQSESIAAVGENIWKLVRACRPFLHAIPGGTFLDIGCYSGEKTAILTEPLQAGLVIGLDINARALASAAGRGLRPILVDLNSGDPFPIPAGAVDGVHAGEVIEHLFDPDRLLTEIHRVLKPDGYAVISTPNLASWRNRIALLAGWQPFSSEVSTAHRVGNPMAAQGGPVGHLRLFTPAALVELLAVHGFRLEAMAGWAVGKFRFPAGLILQPMDWFVEHAVPQLCDGLVVLVRKTRGAGRGAGWPGDAG